MLRFVTVTGADDAVDPRALLALSLEFPFVEWGILMSASRAGTPRYPTRRWMVWLENTAKGAQVATMHMSAHFCGEVAREAMAGRLHDLPVIERVERIQINGYTPRSAGTVAFASRMPCYEIVLQVRSEDALQEAAHDVAAMKRGSVLFDPSGGRGLEPFKWPRAPAGVHMGYAGGIKPDNVRDTIQRIYEDSGMLVGDFWIDMESGVRDAHDAFDLARVRHVLETVRPMVGADP